MRLAFRNVVYFTADRKEPFTLYSEDGANLTQCPVCSGLLYPAKIYVTYSATISMKHHNEGTN